MMRYGMRSARMIACGILTFWAIGLAAGAAFAAGPDAGKKLDYARDVRPILSDNCFACHGPDAKARKAELRLDRKNDAFRDRDGYAVIVPGDIDASAIVERLKTDDKSLLMPPKKFGKTLKKEQIETIERWIAQGASWKDHWSFVAPEKTPIPAVKNPSWPKDSIDSYILARLEAEGLSPSPEADKTELIRRVTLDLTGLPPTLGEIDAFLADSASNAYEKVVDRLLASPRHGERLARDWLDAARYGDTHGLHLDNYREIWPYRDWVIKAFNNNMPYDAFIVAQLAGDLVPDSTLDKKTATGFIRGHVTTSEGGSIDEEVYVRNIIDRVETTGTVFMGLTIGCARCHDHKYDPISTKNFYQMFAYFNNGEEGPLDGNSAKPAPVIKVPSAEQTAALAGFDREIAATRGEIKSAAASFPYDETVDATAREIIERRDYVWIDDAVPRGAKTDEGGANRPWTFVSNPAYPVASGVRAVRGVSKELSQFVFTQAAEPLKVGEGDVFFAYVFIDPLDPPREVMLQWYTTGWLHRAYWGENAIAWGKDGTGERRRAGERPASGKWVRLEVAAADLGIKPGTTISGWAFTQQGGTVLWDRAGIETWTPQAGQTYDSLSSWVLSRRAVKGEGLPAEIRAIVDLSRDKRSPEQHKQLRDYFIEHAYVKSRAALEPLIAKLAKIEDERRRLDESIPTTLVFSERKEIKPAYILERGEYDRKRDKVDRATPEFLPPSPSDAPKDRLGLARWLVSREHPLTARVEVNRLWRIVFGTGLVKTAEDFGSQGEPPSHPELLDRLAVEFRELGWDIKKILKRIVMTATYKQTSKITRDRLAKDPADRLLSRAPRYRLDAETIRDQALALGGLLVEKIGGPSVKPPQPPGLWSAVAYVGSNTGRFVADTEPAKIYRRSMYTFWKRTSPPPQMTAFDAPSRETCTVRRERTNTPLQALLLMNEKQFLEASRGLAERSFREGGKGAAERIAWMFRVATARNPEGDELSELVREYNDHMGRFVKDFDSARKLVSAAGGSRDSAIDAAELASTTLVSNLILNLDEVVSKE